MDLKNIEQYKSARRATDDEILEYRKISKRRRKTNIWEEGQVFVVEAQELLHKITNIMDKIKGATKFTIFVDGEGNYINEWFCDGVIYEFSKFQEFPDYPTTTEKFFVIKYNEEIIVERKKELWEAFIDKLIK